MRNIFLRANNVPRERMNDREKGMALCNRILGAPRWFDDARKRDLTAGRALSREQRRENRENSSGKRITRRGRPSGTPNISFDQENNRRGDLSINRIVHYTKIVLVRRRDIGTDKSLCGLPRVLTKFQINVRSTKILIGGIY